MPEQVKTIKRFLSYNDPSRRRPKVASIGLPIVEFHAINANKQEEINQLPPGGGIDVTPYVTQIVIRKLITSPWETISLTMQIPPDAWHHIFPGRGYADPYNRLPETGFWVVIRQPHLRAIDYADGYPALAWGYVNGISYGMRTEDSKAGLAGLSDAIPATVQAESWWRLVNRQRIVLAPGISQAGLFGSVYNWDSWVSTLNTLMTQVSAKKWHSLTKWVAGEYTRTRTAVGYPGFLFQSLWNGIGLWDETRERERPGMGLSWLRLPTTLISASGTVYVRPKDIKNSDGTVSTGDDQVSDFQDDPTKLSNWQKNPENVSHDETSLPVHIKDEIPLVWNRYTAWRFAPMRLPQQYIVPGEAINAWNSLLPSGTLGQWLTNNFQPDMQIVELFPSLEMPVLRTCDPPLQFPIEDSAAVDPTTAHPYDSQGGPQELELDLGVDENGDPRTPAQSTGGFLGVSGQRSPDYWLGQGMGNLYQSLSKEELAAFESRQEQYLQILEKEQAGLASKVDHSLLDAVFPSPYEAEFGSDMFSVQFVKLQQLYLDPEKMTGLGRALGSQPILLYRLRPRMLHPITWRFGVYYARDRYRKNTDENWYKIIPHYVTAELVAHATGLTTSYGSDSCYPSYSDSLGIDSETGTKGVQGWITLDRLRGFNISKSEDDRINGIWVKGPYQPNSQMAPYGYLGDPMIHTDDHRYHGLRMYDVEWPFFQLTSTGTEDEGLGTLKAKISALCDMFYFLMAGHGSGGFLPGRATLDVDYSPAMNPGSFLASELPETPTTKYSPPGTFGVDLKSLIPGYSREGVSSADRDNRYGPPDSRGLPGGISGYCEAVQHTITINQDDGSFLAETQLTLSQVCDLRMGMVLANFPLRGIKKFLLQFRIDGDKWIWVGTEGGQAVDAVWDSDGSVYKVNGEEIDAAMLFYDNTED